MDNLQEKTEENTWQEWLTGKEEALLIEKRKLSHALDLAYESELKARKKFIRARDRLSVLDYEHEQEKKNLAYARNKYEEFVDKTEGRG